MSNVNENNDVVILELDRPRELRLGNAAMKRFSEITKCPMDQLDKEMMRFDRIMCLMYVMLAHDAAQTGEILTPTQVDDLLDKH